jgi:hypothetical protein
MKNILFAFIFATFCLTGCNKPATSARSENSSTPGSNSPVSSTAQSNDALQQKLVEYSGASASACGRLDVQAPEAQLKSASSCAMQAAQNKKPFYVAYDMPGMSVGVAGNSDGKLFTVQSQGGGLTSGACPSQLRVASSGRISCFAPGDMGSMGGGHTSLSSPMGKMPNPPGGADKKPPQ